MDLARASCGTSAVAEYYAWSEGKIPKPHHTALCAHVTTVWKQGGHPRQPASRNLGIGATLTKRCQDLTLPPAEWQRRTKLTCRRLLRASSRVVKYVTSYTKHSFLKKKKYIASVVTLWVVEITALYVNCPILLTLTVLYILFMCCKLRSTHSLINRIAINALAMNLLKENVFTFIYLYTILPGLAYSFTI